MEDIDRDLQQLGRLRLADVDCTERNRLQNLAEKLKAMEENMFKNMRSVEHDMDELQEAKANFEMSRRKHEEDLKKREEEQTFYLYQWGDELNDWQKSLMERERQLGRDTVKARKRQYAMDLNRNTTLHSLTETLVDSGVAKWVSATEKATESDREFPFNLFQLMEDISIIWTSPRTDTRNYYGGRKLTEDDLHAPPAVDRIGEDHDYTVTKIGLSLYIRLRIFNDGEDCEWQWFHCTPDRWTKYTVCIHQSEVTKQAGEVVPPTVKRHLRPGHTAAAWKIIAGKGEVNVRMLMMRGRDE